MKKLLQGAVALLLLLTLVTPQSTTFAQTTEFTYQGRLNDSLGQANGTYDVTFSLFAGSLTNVWPEAVGQPLIKSGVIVSNGLFVTELDFATTLFDGSDRWLEIGIRTNNYGAFETLSPRQHITRAPYAFRADQSQISLYAYGLVGSILPNQINGILSVEQLPESAVTNGATGVNLFGTFSGDGSQLSNVNLRAANTSGAMSFVTNFPGVFTLTTSPNAGILPYSVAAADVNNDGWMDLVCVNGTAPGKVLVLINNGNGGFISMATNAVGNYPYSIATADVNGDGKADLITANTHVSGSLSVLTNNGNGKFSPLATLAVGSYPISVTTADVNSDGKIDLISANYISSGKIVVLTNNGTGGFLAATTNTIGSYPSQVVAADINSDSKVDLIVTSSGGDALVVLTNNGIGKYVTASTTSVANLSAGFEPYSVAVGDFDGDGKPDLISANRIDSTLSVLTNQGGGVFGLKSVVIGAVSGNPQSIIATDVNSDGKLDVVCANTTSNTLSILTNSGSAIFVPFGLLNVGINPISVIAADVNGDGKADLISANYTSGTLSVLTTTPTFVASFTGNGSSLTNLNASQLNSGTVPLAQLSGITSNQLDALTWQLATNLNGGNASLATNVVSGINITNAYIANSTFTGNGVGLTNVPSPTTAKYANAYDLNYQIIPTNGTWLDISVGNNGLMDGWMHGQITATFTNTSGGIYLVEYRARISSQTNSAVSTRCLLNGNEQLQGGANLDILPASSTQCGRNFLVSLNEATNTIKFQITASASGTALVAGFLNGSVSPSFTVTIIRIQ